jgi:hypothetical protein
MDIPTRPPQAGPFLKAPPGFQIRPVDWRNHMGKPGEQMSICSSCYAFAVTSLIQAYYSIQKGGELINFSEQQLVDCCNI